jgi:hypothetical protein
MMKCAVILASGVMRTMVDIHGSVQDGEDKTVIVVAEVARLTVSVVVVARLTVIVVVVTRLTAINVVVQVEGAVVEQMDGT